MESLAWARHCVSLCRYKEDAESLHPGRPRAYSHTEKRAKPGGGGAALVPLAACPANQGLCCRGSAVTQASAEKTTLRPGYPSFPGAACLQ